MPVFKKSLAVFLAFAVSIMSIAAGTGVLTGIAVPDQIILKWLVIYNVAAGFLSLAAAGFLIFRPDTGRKGAIFIVSAHGAVLILLLLLALFSLPVETKSILAMGFRVLVWGGILFLLRKTA